MKKITLILILLFSTFVYCGKEKAADEKPVEKYSAADLYGDGDSTETETEAPAKEEKPKEAPKKTEAPKLKENQRFVSVAKGLVLREEENASSKKLSILPHNTVVTVEATGKEETIAGKKGNWVQVTFKGKKGYVFDGFLSKGTTTTNSKATASSEKSTIPEDATTKYVISKKGLRVRDKAGTNGKVLFLLPYGQAVKTGAEVGEEETIADHTGKWVKVYHKGKEGYTFGGLLSDEKPEKQ